MPFLFVNVKNYKYSYLDTIKSKSLSKFPVKIKDHSENIANIGILNSILRQQSSTVITYKNDFVNASESSTLLNAREKKGVKTKNSYFK